MALTELECAMLDFELKWIDRRGFKEDAIVANFGMPAADYYQRLAPLLRHPDGPAYAPRVYARLERHQSLEHDAKPDPEGGYAFL